MTEKEEFDFNHIELDENSSEMEEDNENAEENAEEGKEEDVEESEEKDKEEEEEDKEGDVEESEEPFIKTLQTKLGYKIIDDEGKEKEYIDDEDGLIEYVKDIEKELDKKSKEKAILELPEEIKNYYNHLALGKSKEEYFNNPLLDIQNVKLSDDIDLAKQIVKTRFMLSGFSEKDAKDMILTLAANGDETIINRGKSDLIYLQDLDKKEKDAAKEKIRLNKIAEEEENKKTWDNINTLVKNRKILDIEIPQNDVDRFLNYLSTPIKDGKTQHQIDAENENLDRNLIYAYQRFKKYNLNDIIKLAINKNKVDSLREKFNKSKRSQSQSKNNNDNFDFEAM